MSEKEGLEDGFLLGDLGSWVGGSDELRMKPMDSPGQDG